jgi:hypothetical protein
LNFQILDKRRAGLFRIAAHLQDYMMLKSTQDMIRSEVDQARKAHPERQSVQVCLDAANTSHHCMQE